MDETKDVEILSPTDADESLSISLARAELDQQIVTARSYPRSIQKAMANILSLATLDEETAESCVYALPRGGKPIRGPSVRLAEIIVSQWGNCRVAARITHVDRTEKFVEAEGVFHDLETNMARRATVRRRISDKHGRLLTDDMILVTGNAACSIASRNAILAGVPKAVWGKALARCEKVIAGDVTTLSENIEQAMKAFAAFGVTPERVCASLDLAGVADIKLDHIVTLRAMHSALKNAEATVEEMFPLPKVEAKKDAAPVKAAPTPPSPDGTPKVNGAAPASNTTPIPPTPPA